MNPTCPSLRGRAVLLLGSCAAALLLSFLALRNALAAHALDSDTRTGYERAVRLEPQNARNWYFLGRSYLYDLDAADPARAVQALRQAVALDPYSVDALLDLAGAYEGEGDMAQARASYLAAQHVYPLSADAAWSYGNFLLRQGDDETALAQLRKALELDPKRSAEAFSRTLGAVSDVNQVLDKMVPPTTDAYLPILHFLSDAGDVQTGELVWYRLVALKSRVPLGGVVPFFDALIHARQPDDAARLWPQAVNIMQNPPPPDPEGSLLWDGGFESGYSGGGFSWHFTPVARDVQIAWDRGEKHSGAQSVRILFNGRENIDFSDVCHQFVPQPGESYLLNGWTKAQSLTSSEGIRLEIAAYSGSGIVKAQSNEVHGTQDWTQLQLHWHAPQDSGFGNVCVKRNMSDAAGSNIQGAAWIDDVSMVPEKMPANGSSLRP